MTSCDAKSSDAADPQQTASANGRVRDVGSIVADDFRPFLNRTFHVSTSDSTADIELFEVKEMASPRMRHPSATRAPFSLLFRGPVGTTFGQGNFCLAHPDFGSVTVMLVPIRLPDGPTDRDVLEGVFA